MKTRMIVNIKVQNAAQRAALRKKAFKLFEKNTRPCEAARILRLDAATVARWFRRFAQEGEAAVKESRRGPKPGHDKNKLGVESLRRLDCAIRDKTPEQLKFPFALWSSRAVVEYVGRVFKVKISRRTARRYMQKLGYTYQCSVKAAREQSAPAVRKWLTEDYPRIKEEAARCGAALLWGDESCVMASETKCRGYSPKGVSPVLRKPANRAVRCNFVSAVGNRGDLYFRTFKGAMNVELFESFLTGLCKDVGTPVFLIVDNLKVHHANKLVEWLKPRANKIRLFYLPSYSPELNPDEFVNRDVKAGLSEQTIPNTVNGMEKAATAHLRKRKKDPDAVKRLFHAPSVRYAAD